MPLAHSELRHHAIGVALPALLLALTTAAPPLAPALPPLAPDVVAIEWSPLPAAIYAGQTFELSLDVLIEGDVEGAGLLQLFPQALDLPLQIEAYSRMIHVGFATDQGAGATTTVVVDGDVMHATGPFLVDSDAAGVRRYRVTRRAHVARGGPITLPAPSARYATATGFRDDLVQGRVPVDRTEQTVRGVDATIEVLPVPETSRPFSFDGAVGTFRISSEIDPSAARVGETVRLTVLVEGATPLHAVPAPHLDAGDYVDLLGTSSRAVDGGTSYTFELTFRSTDCVETPPLTLTAFDPLAEPPAYVIHEAPTHPISIRPAAPAPRQLAETPEEESGASEEGSEPKLLWTPLTLAFILTLAVASVLRRRQLRNRTRS